MDLYTLSRYMGHASIYVTTRLYGHLVPGSHATDAAKLDAYLASGQAGV